MSRLGPVLLLAALLAALLWLFVLERDGGRATDPVELAPVTVQAPAAPEPVRPGAARSAAVREADRGAPPVRTTPERATEPEPATTDPPRVQLSGRLVDTAGAAAEGVALGFYALFDGEPESLATVRMYAGSQAAAEAATDAEGRFQLWIPAGTRGQLFLARGTDWIFAEGAGWGASVAGLERNADLGDLAVRAAASVAGRVVDADAEPIAGAQLTVSSLTSGGVGTLFVARDLRSSADGAFMIRGLDGGRFWLDVRAEGRVYTGLEIALAAGEERDDLEVVLSPGWTATGVVLDGRGEPIVGASVVALRTHALSTGGTLERRATTPSVTGGDGSFSLGGLARPAARIDVSAPLFEGETVEAVVGERLRIILRRRGAIHGRLVDVRGGGVAESRVRAIATSADSTRGRAPVASIAKTDADGHFMLRDLAAGEYVLLAEGREHPPASSEPVRVEPEQSVEGVLLVAQEGGSLALLVRDTEGAPIVDARVRLERAASAQAGDAARPWSMAGSTDEGGRWRASGLLLEELQLTVEHEDHIMLGPLPLRPQASDAPEVALTLQRGARLEVRVVDPHEVPTVGGIVRVQGPLGTDGETLREARTGASGSASFGPLAAGDYDVTTRAARGLPAFVGVLRPERIFVPAGETVEHTLVRASPVTVSGFVRDRSGEPVVGAEVRALAVEVAEAPLGAPGVARSGGDGRYSLEGLAPGRWKLRCSVPPHVSHRELPLDVPPGVARVERNIELGGGAVAVQVVDEAGAPVGGAALRFADAVGPRTPWPGGRVDLSRLAQGVTDEHGRATFEGLSGGEYTLSVEAADFARARVPVAVREGEVVEVGPVELVRGGVLALELDGRPTGWGVEVRRLGADDVRVVLPGSDGLAPLRLAAGRCELRLMAAPDPARADRPATPWSAVEIRSGETTRFDLRALALEIEALLR